ncbi:MAG: pyridoxal-phosphate dependent enzyme, partial [Anaerolineaceae bacterium]
MLKKPNKVSFLDPLPTPIHHLPTLSKELGVELYLKRDDLTPYGAGGNKLRKLEYLLYEAQQKGATTLLTVGGAQTNHGRLTAAVAAKFGLKCVIVCMDEYPGEVSANILLDTLMG